MLYYNNYNIKNKYKYMEFQPKQQEMSPKISEMNQAVVDYFSNLPEFRNGIAGNLKLLNEILSEVAVQKFNSIEEFISAFKAGIESKKREFIGNKIDTNDAPHFSYENGQIKVNNQNEETYSRMKQSVDYYCDLIVYIVNSWNKK